MTIRSQRGIRLRAFTLIEIMLVIGILALVLAMSVPTIYRGMTKEPMRKTIVGLQDAFEAARAGAILTGQKTSVVFHPLEKTYSVEGGQTGGKPGAITSGQIPDTFGVEMLDVNMMDFRLAESARVQFHPDGTCDEFTLVVVSPRNEYRKISLEPMTGLYTVEDLR
ncbi:MAG: hypothetical protein RLY20_2400 [Verrucomicrobiota bacterium]|jgi:prepilin-type N-terminal cleavage/methylation domain-containing protein